MDLLNGSMGYWHIGDWGFGISNCIIDFFMFLALSNFLAFLALSNFFLAFSADFPEGKMAAPAGGPVGRVQQRFGG